MARISPCDPQGQYKIHMIHTINLLSTHPRKQHIHTPLTGPGHCSLPSTTLAHIPGPSATPSWERCCFEAKKPVLVRLSWCRGHGEWWTAHVCLHVPQGKKCAEPLAKWHRLARSPRDAPEHLGSSDFAVMSLKNKITQDPQSKQKSQRYGAPRPSRKKGRARRVSGPYRDASRSAVEAAPSMRCVGAFPQMTRHSKQCAPSKEYRMDPLLRAACPA